MLARDTGAREAAYSARFVMHLNPASHVFDRAFAALGAREKMFSDGWGDAAMLASIDATNVWPAAPKPAEPRWDVTRVARNVVARDGAFDSPVQSLPDFARRAHVRWLRSTRVPSRAACVVLAASGEEGFARRAALFGSLVHEGIELFLVENAFYGARRRPGQRRARVLTVSDQLQLNIAMVQEARALLAWLAKRGAEVRGVAGFSMAGAMAAVVGALTRESIAVIALATGDSPAPIYTEGLLSRSVDFDALGRGNGGADHARHRLAALFDLARLTRLPPPVRVEAAVLLGARRDGYVFAREVQALVQHWKGCRERWIDAGHVSAVMLHAGALRSAVRDAFVPAGIAPTPGVPRSIVQAEPRG